MGLIHCLHEPVSCVIGVVKTTRISLSRVQRIAHVITAVKSQHSLKNKEKVGQLLIFQWFYGGSTIPYAKKLPWAS